MLNITELEGIVNDITKKLSFSVELPCFKPPFLEDYYTISVKSNQYCYYLTERGSLVVDKFTSDINELLFWIFEDVLINYAFDYEFKNRIPNQDYRIIAFNKHIDLLEQLQLDQKYIDDLKRKYNKLIDIEKFKQKPVLIFDLKYLVEQKAREIGINQTDLPIFTTSMLDLIDTKTYVVCQQEWYLYIENGNIQSEYKTSNYDELIYLIFKPLTFIKAKNTISEIIKNEDKSKFILINQIELLTQIEISTTFIDKLKLEQKNI